MYPTQGRRVAGVPAGGRRFGSSKGSSRKGARGKEYAPKWDGQPQKCGMRAPSGASGEAVIRWRTQNEERRRKARLHWKVRIFCSKRRGFPAGNANGPLPMGLLEKWKCAYQPRICPRISTRVLLSRCRLGEPAKRLPQGRGWRESPTLARPRETLPGSLRGGAIGQSDMDFGGRDSAKPKRSLLIHSLIPRKSIPE